MTTQKQTLAERQAAISEGMRAAWARRKATTTPKLPPPKETMLVKQILTALDLTCRGSFWRNNTGATPTPSGSFVRYGAVGAPDILGYLAPLGRLVAIEVKRPGGKLSVHQAAWLKDAKACGVLCGVAHSVEEAIALIEGGGR
jgi:hypothetical protein